MKQAKFGSPNRLTTKKADMNRDPPYLFGHNPAGVKGQINLVLTV